MNLSISKKNARIAYKNADSCGKELLEHLLGREVFSEKITDRIKTFENALEETGKPNVPEFKDVPEDLREYFQYQYKAIVIAEALNEGWEADYKDSSQRKWYPWFYISPSGFAFHDSGYVFTYPSAGRAARLCLKSEELADYAGKQFKDIYEGIILK
ncbi:MAG: hypothetical protein LBG18_07865 [Mediterranea sp.]|jgi:hypothetical protein|nr:hypothetical protein [Mediterranea sp.]